MKALEYLERAIHLSESSQNAERYAVLAKAAFEAGEWNKAGLYSSNALVRIKTEPRDWNYGNLIHDAHSLAGRVALKSGDLEEAKRNLLDAGKTPGSPQLNSFGPNFALARELLAKGERKTVLDYLDLVGLFWGNTNRNINESNENTISFNEEKARMLAKWKREIQEGKIPSDTMWKINVEIPAKALEINQPVDFVRARETAQLNSIINNLRIIEGGKGQWALEAKKGTGDTPLASDIGPYLKGESMPAPVVGEIYVINPVGTPAWATLPKTVKLGPIKAGGTVTLP